LKLHQGSHIGVLDIINFKIQQDTAFLEESEDSEDELTMPELLRRPIPCKFAVKALSQCVVLQLSKQNLNLMFTEFEDVFNILIQSELP